MCQPSFLGGTCVLGTARPNLPPRPLLAAKEKKKRGGGKLRASETAGREGGWRAGKKVERAKEEEEENEGEVRTSRSGLSVKVSDLYIYIHTETYVCVYIKGLSNDYFF